jgi:hypothetical protein
MIKPSPLNIFESPARIIADYGNGSTRYLSLSSPTTLRAELSGFAHHYGLTGSDARHERMGFRLIFPAEGDWSWGDSELYGLFASATQNARPHHMDIQPPPYHNRYAVGMGHTGVVIIGAHVTLVAHRGDEALTAHKYVRSATVTLDGTCKIVV